MKTIIHVNQHYIKYNQVHNTNLPIITVKSKGKTLYAWGTRILGSSDLEYHKDNPLSCGARVWVSTQSQVVLLNEKNEPFNGITFNDCQKLMR